MMRPAHAAATGAGATAQATVSANTPEEASAGAPSAADDAEAAADDAAALLPLPPVAAPAKAAEVGSSLSVAMLISINVAASISIVVLNKVLFQTLRFPFVTLLTAFHFLAGAGFLSLGASPRWGLFVATPKPDLSLVWRLAAAGAVSIVLTNYSLQLNALGTFQLLKAAVLPTVMALSLLLHYANQAPTLAEGAAAALVIIGSCVSVTSDVTLTPIGLGFGCAGVLLTALFQMWSSAFQPRLGMSAIQLLHASSLPQGLLTLAASLFIETDWARHFGGSGVPLDASTRRVDLWTYSYPPLSLLVAFATCIVAVLLNWSSFSILGRTSAVTMQITTQAKSALIIGLDMLLFPRAIGMTAPQTAAFVLGTSLCLGGALWYGLLKARGK